MLTAHASPPLADAPSSLPAHAGEAAGLLDSYRVGDRLLATPSRTLLGRGVHRVLEHDERPVSARLRSLLDDVVAEGRRDAVVLGAIPFAPDAAPSLVVPETLHRAGPLMADPLVGVARRPERHRSLRVVEEPAPEVYGRRVAESVERIIKGELAKVVLARTLRLDVTDETFDVASLVRQLARRDVNGYTFAVPTQPEAAGAETLLGSSPELLVARRGDQVIANPLAGSAPRSADLAEDVRRAADLLRSAKDLHEHAVVVQAVAAALAPFCQGMDVPTTPTLVRTATMWHLSTTVSGTVRDPRTTSLDLASALHPTPAVCGTPTDIARSLIAEYEPVDRGFFTGMVGWADASGDGEWVVTIRCAQAGETSMRLYAGAGVVAASDPAAETAETGAKFRTLLDVVGAEL